MIKTAIVGYGNIGKAAHEAILASEDFSLKCIVEVREISANVPVLKSISELSDIDVAVICMPSRAVPAAASALLSKGISTVDSFDIHTGIADLRSR